MLQESNLVKDSARKELAFSFESNKNTNKGSIESEFPLHMNEIEENSDFLMIKSGKYE